MANKQAKNSTKWALMSVALFLAFVMIAGLCLQVFGTGKVKPSEWFKHEEQLPAEGDGKVNPVIDEAAQEHGIKLMSAAAPLAAEEAGYQSSYTLTAVVQPADADNKKVTWSMAWENPSSAWATGKNIVEYFSLTYGEDVDVNQSDGTQLEVTAKSKKPFGEPVVVTVRSNENAELFAQKRFQFVKQIKTCGFTVKTLALALGMNETIQISYEKPMSLIDNYTLHIGGSSMKRYGVVPYCVLTDGTITPDIDFSTDCSFKKSGAPQGNPMRNLADNYGKTYTLENSILEESESFYQNLFTRTVTEEEFSGYLTYMEENSYLGNPFIITVTFTVSCASTTNLFKTTYTTRGTYAVDFTYDPVSVTSVALNDSSDFCF